MFVSVFGFWLVFGFRLEVFVVSSSVFIACALVAKLLRHPGMVSGVRVYVQCYERRIITGTQFIRVSSEKIWETKKCSVFKLWQNTQE